MSSANKETTGCPCCGVKLECLQDDISQCPCATLVISDRIRERLAATYTGCLCIACLGALAEPP